MKIRIKGNSIRYRVNKTDIDNFLREGHLEDRTVFPNGTTFFYCLQQRSGIENMQADYSDHCVTIYVPDAQAAQWTGTEIVGFGHTVELENGNRLFLLIEKDFACLEHTTEDQSDNYPNPNKVC
jgi:hypothetical protein